LILNYYSLRAKILQRQSFKGYSIYDAYADRKHVFEIMIRQGNMKEKLKKTVKLQFAQKFCVYLLPIKKVIARITKVSDSLIFDEPSVKDTWKDAIESKLDDILMERDPIKKSNDFA